MATAVEDRQALKAVRDVVENAIVDLEGLQTYDNALDPMIVGKLDEAFDILTAIHKHITKFEK